MGWRVGKSVALGAVIDADMLQLHVFVHRNIILACLNPYCRIALAGQHRSTEGGRGIFSRLSSDEKFTPVSKCRLITHSPLIEDNVKSTINGCFSWFGAVPWRRKQFFYHLQLMLKVTLVLAGLKTKTQSNKNEALPTAIKNDWHVFKSFRIACPFATPCLCLFHYILWRAILKDCSILWIIFVM